MILCIAEKPSVAKDIGRVIGATTLREGYVEGNGYCVTGPADFCTLKDPHDYHPYWSGGPWYISPSYLTRFGIKLLDDKGV